MSQPPDAAAWLLALDHPQKEVVAAVREQVLAASPTIEEGIKWNAVSFRTTEWFATFNVRGPRGPKPVMLVLHLGARTRGAAASVADPTGLLTWLGADRATITFADLDDVARKAPALAPLLREWITRP